MGEITIPGGGTMETHDPGVTDKMPRAMTDLKDRMKTSPVFDVQEGGGDNRGAGGGGAWGGDNAGGDSNPAGPSGSGLW